MRKLSNYLVLAFFVLMAALSCKKDLKENSSDQNLDDKLTPAMAKQWYTQKFAQTDYWRAAWAESKKMPDWKNPIYKKIGDKEMLEFPLLKEHTSLRIPGANLSSTQLRQVVNASLKKVVFIKNSENRIVIREIDYIPDWDYLQRKSFDISKVSLGLEGDDFTGVVEVKDWKGIMISMRVVENGKITKRVSRASTQSAASRATVCEDVQYCMWYEDCVVIGDQWTNDCGEPYMDPNDCYFELECTEIPDDDPCLLYGECGGGGDGGGDGGSPNPVQSVVNTLTDPCKVAALGSITNGNLQNFVTSFYNNHLIPTDSKFNLVIKESPNITVNGQPAAAYTTSLGNNTWEITISSTYYTAANGYNMSQQAWAQVIAHEIIHVAILANNVNPGGNDHALMFMNFIEPMKNLMKDAFGMSESDALGLALTGMNDLWGYADFDQLMFDKYGKHTADVQATLDLYTKGTGGTKC